MKHSWFYVKSQRLSLLISSSSSPLLKTLHFIAFLQFLLSSNLKSFKKIEVVRKFLSFIRPATKKEESRSRRSNEIIVIASNMCSKFEGDLADIIRGSSGGGGGIITRGNKMMTSSEEVAVDPTWQFPSNPIAITTFSSEITEERLDGFGDPFPNMQDPLLQDLLDTPISPSTYFTSNNNTSSHISNHENNVTNNIYSRMGYQITSSVDNLTVSPAVAAARPRVNSTTSMLVSSDDLINNSGTSKGGHVMESQVLQISPPRNTGIKRRKSQAKKVVCIPAPAPANSSRQSGEVVPSDLWAWRKYGQKPIKGSPYPRGYYRCSSSKGCSARKQVERSRTDPNMLVITYTCEHNHPWPTQRNALAGSTRSSPHTSKNNGASSSSTLQTSPSSSFSPQQPTNTNIFKEDEGQKESNSTGSDHLNVKEEDIMEDVQKRVEMENHIPPFSQTYRPALHDESNYYHHSEDFFADMGEIEADPLSLLFENNQENKEALDSFSFYDWAAENNDSSNSNTSGLLGGEVKGDAQENP